MNPLDEYSNPDLWTRDEVCRHGHQGCGGSYSSTPTAVPMYWSRRYRTDGKLLYTSGQYDILRHKADGPYMLYRNGVELFGGLCSRLKDAKAEARVNARGNRRMHVA